MKKKYYQEAQPQLLGTITYKNSETSDTSQKIESVESTASVVMEKFETEEKILPQDNTIERTIRICNKLFKSWRL